VSDFGARHEVVEAGEDESLVDLPLQFAFQYFVHEVRLPPEGSVRNIGRCD
jgi:hypothetical protein